jgi:hypothetical protein
MAASIIAAHFSTWGISSGPGPAAARARLQNQALAQAKKFLHYRIQVTAAGAHGVDDRINIILDGTGFFNSPVRKSASAFKNSSGITA